MDTMPSTPDRHRPRHGGGRGRRTATRARSGWVTPVTLKLSAGGDLFESAGEMRSIEAMAKRNKVKVEAAW